MFKFLQTLNAIPDQDLYYDMTDSMEEQGMEGIMKHHMTRPGADADLLEQFQIYDAALSHEDGVEDSKTMDNMRWALAMFIYLLFIC